MKQQNFTLFLPIIMLCTIAISGTLAVTSSVNADDNPAIDDTINITVDTSCTMGQTVTSSHTTELNPGETNTTIGQSRIAAYCNDNEGYAIYAIGYTNGEYGNTNLVSTDGNHTIPTSTSGSNSYWNMRLTQGTASGTTSYLPTMVNEFTTSTAIPSDYAKVAYRDSSTISQNQDPTETGSYFTTTYEAHISTTQPAGVYNGQVQYVMVHPAGAPAPEIPKTINDLTYMQDFATLSSDDKASVLRSMPYGEQYQLKDIRDQKDYYISKLKDGNIWMTQNLDFDIDSSKTYNSADTDLPSGVNWTPVRSTTTDTAWDTSTTGQTVPHSYNPGDRYWNGNVTDSSGTIDTNTTTSGDTHYHIGNYYNWTAAVAMNNSSSYTTQNTDVNQSVCPAGWMLPKSGTTLTGSGSFQYLVYEQRLIAGTSGNIQKSPTYFVYGGFWSGGSSGVGHRGDYWSSVIKGSSYSYRLYFGAEGGLSPQVNIYRDYGCSLRCVAR